MCQDTLTVSDTALCVVLRVVVFCAESNCTSWLVNEVCYSDDDEHENKWCAIVQLCMWPLHLCQLQAIVVILHSKRYLSG